MARPACAAMCRGDGRGWLAEQPPACKLPCRMLRRAGMRQLAEACIAPGSQAVVTHSVHFAVLPSHLRITEWVRRDRH